MAAIRSPICLTCHPIAARSGPLRGQPRRFGLCDYGVWVLSNRIEVFGLSRNCATESQHSPSIDQWHAWPLLWSWHHPKACCLRRNRAPQLACRPVGRGYHQRADRRPGHARRPRKPHSDSLRCRTSPFQKWCGLRPVMVYSRATQARPSTQALVPRSPGRTHRSRYFPTGKR